MTPSPTSPSEGWPRLHAYLQADGSGAITLDGTTSILNEASTDDARRAIVVFATESARRAGGPVRMTSTDPDGQWWLVVSPDGSVRYEDPPRDRRDLNPVDDPALATVGAGADHPTSPGSPEPVARHAADPEPDQDWPDPGPDELPDEHDAFEAREDPAPAEPPAVQQDAEPVDERPEHVPARAWRDEPEQPATPAPWDRPTARPSPPTTPVPAAVLAPVSASPAAAPAPTPVAAWPPQQQPAPAPVAAPLPTLNDLLDSRPAPPAGPAERGWQGLVRRLSFGAIKLRPGPAELRHRSDVAAVQRSLAGPRTIVVVNPKGGAHKTTATMLVAATFGLHRGGYTLAWDNNETRGTLGWRAVPARHTNTAVNLLADLERFDDPTRARIGDLDNYVRSQGSAQFDVLASDEDARASASIDAMAFRRLHAALSRFYRIMVIDTGNNMRASNWGAALEAADQLVIVSTVREDTAASAAWLVDGLRSRMFEDKVANAVMLLSAPGLQPDPALRSRLHSHFGQLTRAVIDVPYDPALVDGAAIDVERLQPATREAWLHATAVIAEGL